MMEAPLSRFTAVIPLYNKAKTINRAIRSVLGQTGVDVHLVIVDDGSTDGSVAAIDKALLPSIELVREVNAGPGRARNAGAARAKGEFIAFLDADDEWEPGYLAAAAAALDAHPECAAYVAAYTAGAAQHIQKNVLLDLIPETGPRAPDGFSTPADIKAYVDCFHSSSTVVRTASFRRYGGFFDRERSLYGEDSYLWLQIAFGERVYFDRTSLVHFHVEDSALGAKQRGRHPRRPALIFPEPLYENCPPTRRPSRCSSPPSTPWGRS